MGTPRKRRLHIDGKEWIYLVIHDMIEIRDINNKNWLVKLIELPGNEGWTNDNLERAHRKHAQLPAVTPGMIKHYIETTLLGKTLPPFVQKYDDKDHRQEEYNTKHWLHSHHRTLHYRIAYSYGLKDEFAREDLEHQEKTHAVPLDVIKETIKNLERPPYVLMFTLEGAPAERDNPIFVHHRPESGEGVYAVFGKMTGGRMYANLLHVEKEPCFN